jgi:hypothetical protein
VSNDGPWILFITLSCTCSVALHYINYSQWWSSVLSESITPRFPRRRVPGCGPHCK